MHSDWIVNVHISFWMCVQNLWVHRGVILLRKEYFYPFWMSEVGTHMYVHGGVILLRK
jgi:hypothetical protein